MREEDARWERVSALFAEASEMPAARRGAFLARACDGDDALRGEVEALLAASGEAERFFGELADAAIPPALEAIDGTGEFNTRIGRTYGPYRVIEEIGRGGMGVVFRAEDTRLHRTAALKFLPRSAFTDPASRDRLVLEARAASKLDDPNICTIFSIEDTPDGETFIAMAYYPGETLAQRLERGLVPVGEGLAIAVGIARGLAVAHARGLTHRDLTPKNVMLTGQDRVKILDFGLARAAGEGAGASVSGTPSYMPPEAVAGEAASPASDVWSLGVTLYELFTGRRPFEGPNLTATIEAVLTAAPKPPRLVNPKIPEALERLILRMLSKAPADRPRDANAVRLALEPILERQRTRRNRIAVTGVVLALAAIVLALVATRTPAAPPRSMPAVRLVLLPIVHDTTNPDAVYLARGLHEILADELARFKGIALISWATALEADNSSRARRRLMRALGAAAVLEGQVFPDSVRLRLHDADDDRILWRGGYDFKEDPPLDQGRAFAVDIAQSLGIATATSDPRLREPGAFATDPRTGHVYEAVPVTLNWYDAEIVAKSRTHDGRTGHLATITSREENEFIRRALPMAVEGQYWLGGFRQVRGGTTRDGWQWVTYEPWEYTDWHSGNPNDYFGEDGLQYWARPDKTTGDSATWNDIDRTSGFEPWVHGFLVEYDAPRK